MNLNQTLLETLLEIQVLDRVPRSGYSLRGVPEPESVSEHSFHLTFLVWVLVAEEPRLDRARVMELALLHDVAEARFGDLPRSAAHYLPTGAKAAAETAAAEEILAPLGPRAAELHAEYSARESPEARFVSACDKLQLLIKASLYESWGSRGLDELWEATDPFPDGGFAGIRRIYEELRQRREEAARSRGL
jgi:putative hydrolase of HD superfamily